MSELGKALGNLFRKFGTDELVRGQVKSIDKVNKTCVVIPTDGGAEYVDVKLTAGEGSNEESVVMYPKVNSWVYIGKLQGNDADTFVTKMTEVDEIVFHNGTNGGLVITPELVKQIDKNTAAIKKIQDAFDTWVPVVNDGGGALKIKVCGQLALPSLPGTFPFMELADLSKVENKKIKH